MAGTLIPWLAFFLFLFLLAASISAEVKWLVRKGWTTQGRAAGFVFTTDVLGLGIGGIIVFVAFFGMFMMVMGPAGRGSNAPEAAYILVTGIAVILSALVFFLTKRIFLLIFKIGKGTGAWVYSLVSTLAIIFVLIPPPLLMYLVVTLWKL